MWGEFISILKEVIGMATRGRQVSRSAKKLFAVKYSDWIEAHGAQCRDMAGRERDSRKEVACLVPELRFW